LLSRPKPALASIFGIGLLIDTKQATWDEQPLLRYRIQPRSIEQQLVCVSSNAFSELRDDPAGAA
jgi:hypothetical protein